MIIFKCHKLNIPQIVKHKKFRNLSENRYPFSHLKTFKYKLYKNLDLDDLKKNGEYIKSATDAAIMYPLLEMAGKHINATGLPITVLFDKSGQELGRYNGDFEWDSNEVINYITQLKNS